LQNPYVAPNTDVYCWRSWTMLS